MPTRHDRLRTPRHPHALATLYRGCTTALAIVLAFGVAACTSGATRSTSAPMASTPANAAKAPAAVETTDPAPRLSPSTTAPARTTERRPVPASTRRPAAIAGALTSPLGVGGGGGGGTFQRPARYGNAGAASIAADFLPSMPATGRPLQAYPPPEESIESTEAYTSIWDNPFLSTADMPLSTFAIDVDTASYSNVRRFLTGGQAPPIDAVRIEELVNYFPYDDPLPDPEGPPLRVNLELADAPWRPEHRLLRVNLTSRPIALDGRPLSNLVFLIDVSGSMQDDTKLPLVKAALRLLVEQLGENDRVAIVVYAGSSGLVLPSTDGRDITAIMAAIDALEAGGSTHGSEGIALAYETALANFIPGGSNRVILTTDGDFNVGVTEPSDLEDLIREKAKSGVFLTALGFGMGNLKDGTLERLADRGNGHYAYIDTPLEARKVFVEEIGGTLVTVAKDVKLQIEFNPARVAGYRLLGYENRLLAAADFNDDTKDGGEVGAGHRVTALYEIVPVGRELPTALPSPSPSATRRATALPTSTLAADAAPSPTPDIDSLRYAGADPAVAGELLTVKLRHKLPAEETSTRATIALEDAPLPLEQASANLRFSAAVAAFGMLLRASPHSGEATYAGVRAWAAAALGDDPGGYRAAFLELVDMAAMAGR